MKARQTAPISARKQPRQARSERLVATILEAAIRVLARDGGCDGDIAEVGGISKTAGARGWRARRLAFATGRRPFARSAFDGKRQHVCRVEPTARRSQRQSPQSYRLTARAVAEL